MISRRYYQYLLFLLATCTLYADPDPQNLDSTSISVTSQAASVLAVPSAIDYQASIYNASGVPLDGSITITFSIWDQFYGGSMLWTEQQTVHVRDGYITAELGLIHTFTAGLFNYGDRYLQVNIQGEDLTPRKRLVSVPFSFYSNNSKMLSGHTIDNFYTTDQANNSAQNTIDASRLGGSDYTMYLTMTQLDARYVKKGQLGSVTGDMILDGSIQQKDLDFTVNASGITNIVAGDGLYGGGQSGAITLSLSQDYKNGTAYNNVFVRTNQANSVTSSMIRNESITSEDIQNGSIKPHDFGFTIGTIYGVSAGIGLTGGGESGSVQLALNEQYRSGEAFDIRFVKLSSKSVVNSAMIKNNEISSEDIMDGTIRQEDMAFHYGDITSISTSNGITGGVQSGDALLALEPVYVSGQKWDDRFVNSYEINSISSAMIQNGTIKPEDMGFNAGDITSVNTSGGVAGGGITGDISLQLAQPYLSGTAYDGRFVNEGQAESVNSSMIQNHTITSDDISFFAIRGEHFADNLSIQKEVPANGVITTQNISSSSTSAGILGQGYIGVKGAGRAIGVYGEGPSRAIYGRSTSSTGYGLYIEGRAHCTTNDWGDLAEYVPSSDQLESGDVVIIDPNGNSEIVKCRQAQDTRVAGIVSTKPTITVGVEQAGDGRYALALAGIVPCKIACDESIQSGDLLTSSEIPGYATKAVNPKIGTIIGKAMEPFSGGKGLIRVLVTLQ